METKSRSLDLLVALSLVASTLMACQNTAASDDMAKSGDAASPMTDVVETRTGRVQGVATEADATLELRTGVENAYVDPATAGEG